MRRTISTQTIINFTAYIALGLVAIALTCVSIFRAGKFTNAMHVIAEYLGYFVLILSAFGYAKSKRNLAWLALWFVFTVLLVVMLFLV
ncbi:MAG: hypothetical protein J6X00_01240 [Clostridia bacterium]|nr:hypothetical protein [Clostridia bacterium]